MEEDIPTFLVRTQTLEQAKRLKRITVRYRERKIRNPERRKPLDGERVTLRLEDELPRIGCGVRTVIIKRGRKWLHIQECATGRRDKLPVDYFQTHTAQAMNSKRTIVPTNKINATKTAGSSI